jgi:hypothetical protein
MEQPTTAQSATRDGVSSDSAASANWVRELEQRIIRLETNPPRLLGRVEKLEKNQPAEGANFVTHDDLEKRLSETHPTTSPTAVAARLCPECGSPAHKNCKLPPV